MKRNRVILPAAAVMVLVCAAGGYAYTGQKSPGRPARETWFVYLDYTLDLFKDLHIRSYDVKESTFPDPKAPFLVDNDTDVRWKANRFQFGCTHVFVDKGDEGTISWYAGAGSTGVSLELFETGTIGTKGWMLTGGMEGDLAKFGRMRKAGLAFDCSLSGLTADGEHGRTVKESYDLVGARFDGALFYTHVVEFFDASSAFAYVGGEALYARMWLSEEIKASSGSGTCDYALENQAVNQFFLVLGTRMYWESNRTTLDIRLLGSVDGSYSIGLRIFQSF